MPIFFPPSAPSGIAIHRSLCFFFQRGKIREGGMPRVLGSGLGGKRKSVRGEGGG